MSSISIRSSHPTACGTTPPPDCSLRPWRTVKRALAEVSTRQKEIQYSSRTRAGTDSFKYVQRLRRATADLLEKLPDHLRHGPEAELLQKVALAP
jgi:Patatin phospholipase